MPNTDQAKIHYGEKLDVADFRVMLTAAEVVKVVMALNDAGDSWQEMADSAVKRGTDGRQLQRFADEARALSARIDAVEAGK